MTTLLAIYIAGKYKVDLMLTYLGTFLIDITILETIQKAIEG